MSFEDMSMCGCDTGRSCYNCHFDYNDYFDDEHEYLTEDSSIFNERVLEEPSKYPSLKIKTLNEDTFILSGCFEDDEIVKLMKQQHPEFKDSEFFITFNGDFLTNHHDKEFINFKEKMGLFPFEISERILSGKIQLSDDYNNFTLLYFDNYRKKKLKLNKKNEYKYNATDFVKLSK